MKVLITGSSGMSGRALCEELSAKYEVVGLDVVKPTSYVLSPTSFVECDITDRKRTIAEIVACQPDIVLHAAAYTDVDGCQLNRKKAEQVNFQGTKTVALACRKYGAFLAYISTDFVFDGEKKSAYTEEDQPHPINIYGQSKLEGEQCLPAILKGFVIIRTSWLFGKGGKNFVETILNKAKNAKEIKVVNDQVGSPTYTKDLAQGIKRLFDLTCVLPPATYHLKSIYHITNSGSCSWYEFALAIKEIAGFNTEIVPISSEEYSSPTRRPKMSVLDNSRYEQDAGKKLRPWQDALREYLSEAGNRFANRPA